MGKAKRVTFLLLQKMNKGARFSGNDLMQKVKTITGEMHYHDTILRYMREFRETTGRDIVNVDKRKSIYEMMG